MQHANRSEQIRTNTKQLFENLITLDELVGRLHGKFSRHAVYKWVKEGLPHEKIRGRLLFDPSEVALWLKRT
jgi:hypothetical protein